MNKRTIGDRISEYNAVPKETVMELAKLSFAENRELYIENHKGILEYTKELIRIKTGHSVIKITGADFCVSYINKYDVLVDGVFYSVVFEH
ncbi:MAG: YabP/YqfC family sporulation protein [Clostridia bacterium]|nr:YabP/YqfC family sporulation protein [Clostridia bacterium]